MGRHRSRRSPARFSSFLTKCSPPLRLPLRSRSLSPPPSICSAAISPGSHVVGDEAASVGCAASPRPVVLPPHSLSLSRSLIQTHSDFFPLHIHTPTRHSACLLQLGPVDAASCTSLMLTLSLKATAAAASPFFFFYFVLKILPSRITTFFDRVLSLTPGAYKAFFFCLTPKDILLQVQSRFPYQPFHFLYTINILILIIYSYYFCYIFIILLVFNTISD